MSPGQSTELKITYNTYKFAGKFKKYITVTYGPSAAQPIIINLEGYVKPIPMGVLTVKPRKISMGEIAAGGTSRITVPLKNTGDADLVVTKLVSKKFKTLYFDAENSGPIIIAPGRTTTVDCDVVVEKTGRYIDYILVHTNARNVTEKGYKVVIKATGI